MAETPIIIAGNWKMHKTIEEACAFMQDFVPAVSTSPHRIYLAVPFTAIKSVADLVRRNAVTIGAQNLCDASEGAFTGEISGRMIKDAGAQFVIIGHSERRHHFSEDHVVINRKVKRAFEERLQPFLCIGETLEEREQGKTKAVLEEQIMQGLKGLSAGHIEKIVIAYEPVWAIGHGQSATAKEAQVEQKFCRDLIADQWGEGASHLPILYGGSVSSENVAAFLGQPDINGVLVGGASLCAETFAQIVNYQTLSEWKS